MVKASIARNTVELPAFLSIVDFEGKKVLDAGAGIGRAAFKINGFAKSIACVDESKVALQKLNAEIRKKGLQGKIKARFGNIRELPFKSNSFDIAYSLWVLHHYKRDWQGVLKELNRVCKKQGCVIVCFSTEKGSIPRLEAIARANEIKLRKEFAKKVLRFLKKLNGNSFVKTARLPFYFKTPSWAFEVLSETFLPKPLTALQEKKCREFLKKHSSKKGCFLDEEAAFVYSFKT